MENKPFKSPSERSLPLENLVDPYAPRPLNQDEIDELLGYNEPPVTIEDMEDLVKEAVEILQRVVPDIEVLHKLEQEKFYEKMNALHRVTEQAVLMNILLQKSHGVYEAYLERHNLSQEEWIEHLKEAGVLKTRPIVEDWNHEHLVKKERAEDGSGEAESN